MKYRILRLIALLLLLVNLSSCFQGRWQRYGDRKSYYVHRKHYRWHHHHRHGGW